MRSVLTTTCLFASLAVVSPAVAGLITPTGQDRSVSAFARANVKIGAATIDQESAAAPDFAPFSASVDALAVSLLARGETKAWQSSAIQADRILAYGAAYGYPSGGSIEASGNGNCLSRVSVDFSLDAASPWIVAGGGSAAYIGLFPFGEGGRLRVELRDAANTLIFQDQIVPGVNQTISRPISGSGQLGAGNYKFLIEATGVAFGAGSEIYRGTADYGISLIVPEPTAAGLLLMVTLTAGRRLRIRA